MKARLSAVCVFVAVSAATVQLALGANTPRIKITDMRLRSERDSARNHIEEITILTRQGRVEMWGTLTVHVQMQDKAGTLYFGSASFRQPRRSSRTTSVDKWIFHVVTEDLDHPKLTGVWAIYRNNIDAENCDDKKKLVKTKTIDEWVKSNAKSKKLTVRAEGHYQ